MSQTAWASRWQETPLLSPKAVTLDTTAGTGQSLAQKSEPALGATVTRYAQRKLEPPKPETERHALDLAIVNDSASLGAAVDRRPC
jgi:hypothetical protein